MLGNNQCLKCICVIAASQYYLWLFTCKDDPKQRWQFQTNFKARLFQLPRSEYGRDKYFSRWSQHQYFRRDEHDQLMAI